MKIVARLAILALLAILPSALGAQGFRSPAATGQTPPAVPNSTSPSASVPVPAGKGRYFAAPPAGKPTVVVPIHPHYHPPAIVIVETPYYVPYSVTQSAPGVLTQERRYTDTPPAEARTRAPGQLAPFDPTPQEVVERMLRLAALKPGDLLYDLGSGDGRVAIAAAKKFGIRAVGFEIDGGLVKLARGNARKQGVEPLVEFRQQDFLTADLSAPSVVTLYLSYDGNLTVRPRLMSQLKNSARVVSYTFDMAEWQPKISEKYRDGAGNSHLIYLWEIGGRLAFGDGGR